jgi:lipopolysaccharide transport system ATP-binding protein
MIAMQSLCRRVIWLDQGRIAEDGPARQVVSRYLREPLEGAGITEEVWDDFASAPGNDNVRLRKIRVRPQGGQPNGPLTMKTPFSVEVEYWNLLADARLHLTLELFTEQGIMAFTTGNGADEIWRDRPMPAGLFRCVCYVPGDLLNAGWHRFAVFVVKDKTYGIFRYESKIPLEILDLQTRDAGWYGREPGVVQPLLQWTTEYMGPAGERAAVSENL